MNKKILIILILFVSIFSITNTYAQGKKDKNKTVFWFDVVIRTVIDKQTDLTKYTVVRMGKKVSSGTLDEFKEKLWNVTGDGSRLLMGPFGTYDGAYEAMLMYDLKDTTPVENTTEKYWYLLKISFSERTKSYQFERMAAAVASGSKSEFRDILVESLDFKTLAVGPFSDKSEAEESKQIYRGNE